MIPNNDKNRTYSVVYVPKVEGLHKVGHCRKGLQEKEDTLKLCVCVCDV